MKNEPDLTKESLMFMILPMIRVATAEKRLLFLSFFETFESEKFGNSVVAYGFEGFHLEHIFITLK